MTSKGKGSGPTITFDESAAESIIESFGWRVCNDTGYIKDGHRKVPSVHGGPVSIDEFAGVVEYEGETVIIRDNFCDIVDYVKDQREENSSKE